jgi:hypothetical protein
VRKNGDKGKNSQGKKSRFHKFTVDFGMNAKF